MGRIVWVVNLNGPKKDIICCKWKNSPRDIHPVIFNIDEDVEYSATQLDRDVVNPSQIRNIVRTFKDNLPIIFPNRDEVPKTLIFAKTDSHCDDIIKTIRE